MKTVAIISILVISLFGINSFMVDSKYFEIARLRSEKYDAPRKDYVIVIDYTKNIFVNRLYVIDMKTGKAVISCKVSHAYNSGKIYATEFSNKAGTNKSCKGNFVTLGTTMGKFGYSMQVKGLDGGINDNATSRAIIFHSTRKMRTLWSHGCFATSDEANREIIDLTKGGCLVCIIH